MLVKGVCRCFAGGLEKFLRIIICYRGFLKLHQKLASAGSKHDSVTNIDILTTQNGQNSLLLVNNQIMTRVIQDISILSSET